MSKYKRPSQETIKDWGRMWHVEIEERARHISPGKWTILGWWVDEMCAYKSAEYRWGEELQARSDRYYAKHPEIKFPQTLEDLASNGTTLSLWDDYFRWHVQTPHWTLREDGKWTRGGGIYKSYESAVATLAKFSSKAPRWEEFADEASGWEKTYKEHLEAHIHEHNDPYGE